VEGEDVNKILGRWGLLPRQRIWLLGTGLASGWRHGSEL